MILVSASPLWKELSRPSSASFPDYESQVLREESEPPIPSQTRWEVLRRAPWGGSVTLRGSLFRSVEMVLLVTSVNTVISLSHTVEDEAKFDANNNEEEEEEGEQFDFDSGDEVPEADRRVPGACAASPLGTTATGSSGEYRGPGRPPLTSLRVEPHRVSPGRAVLLL